jgi:hypothetical protein
LERVDANPDMLDQILKPLPKRDEK